MTTRPDPLWTIRNALIGAALLLSISFGLLGAERADWLEHETRERTMGVVIGLLVVVTGNYMPKALEPLSKRPGAASKVQALQRFSGWAFVIAGLGHVLVWLVFPVERANLLAMMIVATCVVLVVGRCAWVVMTCRAAAPGAGV